MPEYTAVQWLFFFYFYSLFGWCFESTYVSLKERKLVNRGFLRGTFLPLYGSGAIMMLVVSKPFQDSLILTYLAGCVGATLLEYVTGVTMEALFKVRYWDYSDQPFNFQGQVCLSSTLAWGGLTILMTHVIHKPIEDFVLGIPRAILVPVTMVVTLVMVVDFTLSIKAAMDLRDVLVRMEEAKKEMERIQKRIDVLIAVSKEDTMQYAEQRMDELTSRIEARLADIKQNLSAADLSEEIREELQELREKFQLQRQNRHQLSHVRDYYRRKLIQGNPSMRSVKFREALEEIKDAIGEYRARKDEQEDKEC